MYSSFSPEAQQRELVFEPLGMGHSTYQQPLPAEKWRHAATGHRAGGKSVPGKWHIYPEMAAAGLWTTPSDMARLALDLQMTMAGMAGKLLSQQMVHALVTPQCSAGQRGEIGLGVFLEGTGPAGRFGHAGDNTGFHCLWVSLVERGQGFVVMSNSDAGWRIIEKLEQVIPRVYAWPAAQAVKESGGVKEIAGSDEEAFVGEYELGAGVVLSVQRQGHGLVLHVPEQAPLALRCVDGLVFQPGDLEDTVTFLRNAEGEIDLLVLEQEGREVVARRRNGVVPPFS